jgi:hypothetical protein
VGEVVLAEQNPGRWHSEPSLNEVLDPELISQPADHRLPEDVMRAGKGLHAGQDEPFKLYERLLEKGHIVQLFRPEPANSQTEINGMLRKLIVVLLTGKPLLFGCCYKPAVEK